MLGQMPVRPGDWLQTDPRGANAVSFRLVKHTDLVVGPGSTVELVNAASSFASPRAKSRSRPTRDSRSNSSAPTGQAHRRGHADIYRAQEREACPPGKGAALAPRLRGQDRHESIGSLVAKIDGRDVPLSVGYHKVSVDIRDQIARTTIEESFVNHTTDRLEGTFFFPLPQDASIAGFGMWIGDQLVEADVVEKERAREIYETILREKPRPRPAGMGRWQYLQGPRVPHPWQFGEADHHHLHRRCFRLRGGSFRYQYALQSELLQAAPARQLEIDVKVNSAMPCERQLPTHPTRNALTKHSAHVEFSAKEYTPTQDFEAVVELDGRQSDVV